MKWFRNLVTQAVNKQLQDAGFGPLDLAELQLLIQERRQIKKDSENSANRFMTRLKEMAER